MRAFISQKVSILGVITALATIVRGVGNPLATSDQQYLDTLATKINQENTFPVLRASAKASYQAAHGLPISTEASSSLDGAIDELVFSAIQKAVNTDVYYPKVYWVDAGPRTWFGLNVTGGRYSYDNPDCIYRTIPIDDSLSYVIKGFRHTPGPVDVTFSLISDPNSQNTVSYLSGSDLAIASDGSYTITINSTSADGQTNHIQSTSSAVQLFIRNNLGDWQTQQPDSITVQVVDDVSGRSPITTSDIVSTARSNLAESIITYGVGALGLKTYVNAINTLSSPSQSSTLGTLTSQASSFGHFSLDTDEALVATVTPGEADYFVFPVTNPWSVTVDPGNNQVSLNSQQAVANVNGTYTFVVSIQDPGVYNWVSTSGLSEGTIMVRWQGLPTSSSDGDTSLDVSVQVVPLTNLASVLPSGTKYVTAAQRKTQLAQRAVAYASRTAV